MIKLVIIMVIALGMVSCKKEEIHPDVSWMIEATHKDLSVSNFINNNKVSDTVIKKGSKQTINKSDLTKIEVRCGGCEYKVNKQEIKGDVAFFANGERYMLY